MPGDGCCCCCCCCCCLVLLLLLVAQGSSSAAAGAGAGGSWPQMSLDKHQLARLHGVLGPFMLRRVKADVVAEMVPKTEVRGWGGEGGGGGPQPLLPLAVLPEMAQLDKPRRPCAVHDTLHPDEPFMHHRMWCGMT
jgi:hypothetical protein